MALFSLALETVLKNEGGFVDNPKDPGQATNMGISLRFLKAIPNPALYGVHDQPIDAETIRNLTIKQAHDIYFGEFWNHAPFAQISDQEICNYVFDTAINCGIAPAIKCLQRAVWALWKNRSSLLDDGIMGSNTLIWLERCNPHYYMPALRAERAGHYRQLVVKYPEQEIFLNSWLNRAYESK